MKPWTPSYLMSELKDMYIYSIWPDKKIFLFIFICSYVALYNYKPAKDDEVELKKGDYYTVSNKCQDGWFKGQCLKSGVVGVFPGNYVQLVR